MERDFFKRVNAEKLQSSVQCSGQLHLLMNDGDREADTDSDPDLSLHGIGACSVVGPREKRQRQIDRGRVRRINRVLDVETNVVPAIERAGFVDEAFGQVFPKSPVPLFVGVGQGEFGNRFAKVF